MELARISAADSGALLGALSPVSGHPTRRGVGTIRPRGAPFVPGVKGVTPILPCQLLLSGRGDSAWVTIVPVPTEVVGCVFIA